MKNPKKLTTKNGKVEGAIKNVLKIIQENPYIFHTESDVRALVYCRLLKGYNEDCKTNLKDKDRNNFVTKRVHTEYFGGKRRRIDVVIFDSNDVGKINLPWLCVRTNGGYRPVKLEHAIEIKCSNQETTELGVMSDIKKLVDLLSENKTENAHFILIIRWPTRRQTKIGELKKIMQNAEESCKKECIKFYGLML